jgi:hypothetical protein
MAPAAGHAKITAAMQSCPRVVRSTQRDKRHLRLGFSHSESFDQRRRRERCSNGVKFFLKPEAVACQSLVLPEPIPAAPGRQFHGPPAEKPLREAWLPYSGLRSPA